MTDEIINKLTSIQENIKKIKTENFNTPKIICVSKTFSIDRLKPLIDHGHIHFGENNTLYTYAFVIESIYKGNGYAKMLKRVYLNWAKKQSNLKYVTGHVLSGIAKNFTGNVTILNKVTNWKNTKKVFEYYRRKLDPF